MGFHSVKGSGEHIKGKHKAVGAILQLFGGDADTLGQLCFFRLYTISLGVGLRNKKARANRTAVAALLAREALPYFQSGALTMRRGSGNLPGLVPGRKRVRAGKPLKIKLILAHTAQSVNKIAAF